MAGPLFLSPCRREDGRCAGLGGAEQLSPGERGRTECACLGGQGGARLGELRPVASVRAKRQTPEQLSKSARGLVHFLGIRYCREPCLTGLGGPAHPSCRCLRPKRKEGRKILPSVVFGCSKA